MAALEKENVAHGQLSLTALKRNPADGRAAMQT
jgi:hypothetical protein